MTAIGVIGGGLIGSSWSMIFSSAGFRVLVFEADEVSRSHVMARIEAKLAVSAEKGVLEVQPERTTSFLEAVPEPDIQGQEPARDLTPEKQREQIQTCLKRIGLVSSLSELLSHSFYIQECIPERLELKQALFKEIEETLSSIGKHKIIIGSSTSTLAVSALTARCASYESANKSHDVDDETNFSRQCIVVHPINPPELIPAVELIPAPFTNRSTIQTAQRLLLVSKKKPILVKKEVDGFVVNRLQYALLSEAYRLVHDGVASPEDVDSAICDGLGLRWAFMGPFKTIHLNAPNGVTDYCERYIDAVERITRTQDNSITWNKDTIESIHESMNRVIRPENRGQAYQWRDQSLLSIIKSKTQQ
eukprot:TRINITY_DN5135_c0_g1_i1.p1 TRINITY_DN5135_c0_g1~~TRINITY_DN5135_c0_g1_i1.p1  ORF type:complete len:362 (-),score=77.26 TRINITY_DN5135_c0_g1_i1:73-1158(-)